MRGGGDSNSSKEVNKPSTTQNSTKTDTTSSQDNKSSTTQTSTPSTETKADKPADTTVQNSTEFKFTKEYLNGKTLYNVFEECDSYNPCTNSKWEVGVTKFTNDTMSGYDIKNPNHKISEKYTITDKGYIRYYENENGDSGWRNVKAVEKTNDYISLIWTSEGSGKLNSNKADNEFFYFDLEKAKAKAKAENSK